MEVEVGSPRAKKSICAIFTGIAIAAIDNTRFAFIDDRMVLIGCCKLRLCSYA